MTQFIVQLCISRFAFSSCIVLITMYYVIISTPLYFSFRYVISHTVTVFKVSFRPFSLVTDEGLRPKRFSIKFLTF